MTMGKRAPADLPFGGVNVIFFGDFLQYPAIGDRSLYCNVAKISSKNDTAKVNQRNIDRANARNLFLQVNHVVELVEQMRNDDPEWTKMQNNLRTGDCDDADLALVRSRIVGRAGGAVKSFEDAPWRDAPILTYRNDLRQRINDIAVINQCRSKGMKPVVCVAQDTHRKNSLDSNPILQKCILDLPESETEGLPGYLPLVSGMPILITENVNTELGLANGTRGIFHELVYDRKINTSLQEHGRFPQDTVYVAEPTCALVDIENTSVPIQLPGLPIQRIPIAPVVNYFRVDLSTVLPASAIKSFGPSTQVTIKRSALPIIPAYSMTTHKCQGQTMKHIVIDLVLPGGMPEEIAARLVPLSRVRDRHSVAILRDFPDSALRVKPSKEQQAELQRLHELDKKTKEIFDRFYQYL
ncbi:unnamed protein product [Didymodactylos carnosus]|uniref:ATP-dependent DNA helicase n=1 Tax=Didymodactylos carnosus TaxID=1234261 RepID=A0A8S2JLS8_9BILA|nr:unnamed protein product [Didymodactylos carnosus]CAF3813720.1 unnamed protein product [Didymodactylos carnosus]